MSACTVMGGGPIIVASSPATGVGLGTRTRNCRHPFVLFPAATIQSARSGNIIQQPGNRFAATLIFLRLFYCADWILFFLQFGN
ncbi:hypothetical protein [Ralstonia solanacearum]|uniref:hypothetical protein n=1 Tax=Ralstonia solanacearum TaxID=305 RepID=UPI0011D20D21|nr:hypothetical protein [Ralstonia solanacearum]